MIGEQFLLLPGPTPIPDRVIRAMSKPMINHRGQEFKRILEESTQNIKNIYRTNQHVLIYPASGSGALEAAVVNFISPGDKVLAISIGVFGDRFAKIAKEFGAQVENLNFPWGQAADPQVIKDRIKQDKNHEIKAILITHNETSTGVCNDLKTIKESINHHPALLLIDAVSGLATADIRMDEWGLDVIVSGSQKAFMIPPGLSFIAFNDKAFKQYEQTTSSKYYWDIGSGIKYLEKGQTPYTPAVSLYYGLHEALQMMMEEGLENILSRHMNYRELVRSAIKQMNLQPYAEDSIASTAVTAVLAPEKIGGNKIRRYMLEKFNIVVAGGQQDLDDVIFRIGHLGYVRELDLLSVLGALELTLSKLGHDINVGAGVKQAQQYILSRLD